MSDVFVLWKRVFTVAPEDGRIGLALLDQMEEIERALNRSAPAGIQLADLTDGALFFAGLIVHIEGGGEAQVRQWLEATIKPFMDAAVRKIRAHSHPA